MEFYTYIAYNSKHNKFYIGQTYDINKRINEHNLGISNYTSKYNGGWKLIYYEKFKSRSEAMRREKFLKKQKNKSFYKKLCNVEFQN